VVENIGDVVTQQTGVVKSDNSIHIRGGRSYESAFLLDGVSVQDPLAGTGFGLQLSSNAIEEVEVITGGFNAEYGQATSGVVNVRTREGSDNIFWLCFISERQFWRYSSYHTFNTEYFRSNLQVDLKQLPKFILTCTWLRNSKGRFTSVGSHVWLALLDGYHTVLQTIAKQVQFGQYSIGPVWSPTTRNSLGSSGFCVKRRYFFKVSATPVDTIRGVYSPLSKPQLWEVFTPRVAPVPRHNPGLKSFFGASVPVFIPV